jgi:hypothetical protein
MAARTEAGPPRSRVRGERAEKRDRPRVPIGPDEKRARIMAKAQAVLAQQQLEEMARELRRAARVPFPARVRMRRLLKALFDHVIDHPGTYRLLVGDATPVIPALGLAATTTQVRLIDEVARVLAGSAPTPQVTAASAGIVGFALANIGLCLTGDLGPEHAWRVTCEFCTSQVPPTDLDDRQ